ncbi:E3 ubiquitin-protein ligase TRIM71-like [Rhopilema esculentum]|uniref:E3 ubiquitin-protein ligase TRIM71-like n=1 Tax=Rhopilema esculentum TaxID=499914 RepID=UPI0031DB2ECC
MSALPTSSIKMAINIANVTFGNVKDVYNLECVVCLSTYKHPKVLPCLHAFCEECIENTIRENAERVLECPRCHIDIPIPTKGVDAFPSHSFANNLLNILAVQEPTCCTNCEDQSMANARCLDCVENLCPKCVTAHERIRQTKDHKVVCFEELQNNAIYDALKCPSFCGVHDREMLKYFCETCDDAICRDCAIYDHREHNYVDLKEAVKIHRETVIELLDSTKRKLPVVKLALNEVIEVTNSLSDRRDAVKNLITATVDEHIRTLEEKKRRLVETLDEMCQQKEKVLKDQQSVLEMDLDNLLSSCDFVENILRFGNEAEMMLVKRIMANRLKKLSEYKPQTEPEENDVLSFDAVDNELKDAVTKFGKLETSATFPAFSVADGSGIKIAKVGHVATFNIYAKDRFSADVMLGGDPVVAKIRDSFGSVTLADITDNNDGTYTAKYKPSHKGTHFVFVYAREKAIMGSPFEVLVTAGIEIDRVGPMLLKFGSKGVLGQNNDENFEPWGVAVDQSGTIIVSDHNNHRILFFDKNGKLLHQFGKRGKADGEIWYPAGLAVDETGNIYVADHGNHRIQVFDYEGEFIDKFCNRGNGEGQLKGPCALAIDNQKRLVVADRDNHRIQILDMHGGFITQFGGYGSADGKFNSPRHIAVTNEDEIIVSDTNNYRVQRFDEFGSYIAKFGNKGIGEGQFMCPSGIAVDSEGHIVVADFKNLNVQLFNLKGKYLKKLGIPGLTDHTLFSKPCGACITTSGNILIADRGTYRVQMF